MDEIAEVAASTPKGPACSIAELIRDLPEDEALELQEVLDNTSIVGSHIAKALKKRGYNIAAHTVQRHRRQGCSCEEVVSEDVSD